MHGRSRWGGGEGVKQRSGVRTKKKEKEKSSRRNIFIYYEEIFPAKEEKKNVPCMNY
jgi:hypothetical protein